MIPAEIPAKLSVSISNGMKVEMRLGIKEVRIGRGGEADLLLPDPSVSRLHARICRVADQYILADAESRNGTYVDDKRVARAVLEPGQVIRIGPYRIHFLREEETSPLSADPPTVPFGAHGTSAGTGPATGPRPAPARHTPRPAFGLVGSCPKIKKLIDDIRRVAASDLPVLVEGETGSGKELVCRGIHEASGRRDRPFVVVNCGAISPELIESELFGHEKGAFTGATAQRRGAFEVAHGGTIFLDEIGELPLALQPKLLRALEQKEIKRVGGNETLLVDVRILAATNRSLREETARKGFRDDLYFRISTITLEVPPLRERREDIVPLALHVLAGIAEATGRPAPELAASASEFLCAYAWPGNVRELRNAIQRAAVMGAGPSLEASDFAFLLRPAPGAHLPDAVSDPSLSRWEQAEKTQILAELSRQRWNKTRTAKELGIAKSTLFEKLKKYGIKAPESDRESN